MSQIERGKTRPTGETIAWLAEPARRRPELPRDRRFLERARARRERSSRAPKPPSSRHQYEEAVDELRELGAALERSPRPTLELRALLAESLGAHVPRRGARGDRAPRARPRSSPRRRRSPTSSGPRCSTASACCRYKLSSISTAVALFTEALDLAERSGLPADRLRSHISRLALALLPAPARLGSRPRGRRARARARRRPRRPAHGRPTLLPGVADRRADGPLGARALLRRAREDPSTKRSPTRRTSASS